MYYFCGQVFVLSSIWHSDCSLPQFNSLREDLKTDVLIIGGGIAGILTAFFLTQRGVKCAVVEKNRICGGTTGNTTAKITYQHSLIYDKLLKSGGFEKAKGYLNANKSAFREFENLCKSIDCDFEYKDNYVYSVDDRKKIENELSALEKIGYNAKFYKNTPLPFDIAGAVCFPRQAQFHPLKFLSSVAKKLTIYENTFVREMADNVAVTDFGKIHAKKIIITTHFPFINKHGSYFFKLYQHRSYAVALENAQNVDGMYVDENKKGFSFRNYKNFLILGGGGHRTGHSGGTWNELYKFAKEKYPNSSVKFRWAAQDCMSLDDMPYIGHYSKRTEDLYTASGFNKWGMTGSMLSAMLLSDIVTRRENKYEKLFTPSRSILKPQLLVNGFEATKNLLTPTKKRCPHLGCALKWNRAEHSWDCACHGSRFTEEGRVIDNPANGDLSNAEYRR